MDIICTAFFKYSLDYFLFFFTLTPLGLGVLMGHNMLHVMSVIWFPEQVSILHFTSSSAGCFVQWQPWL